MNIILDDDTYICHPRVIKFVKIGFGPFGKTVLMVDGEVIKDYHSDEEVAKDKKDLNFYFGMSEPVCQLKREEQWWKA